ncbi:phosphatidylserine decarboxylase [Peribacillus glennii]|uniref:phosphatidylserine decarboxylase n=1 Tax=Peribacillus glennii TaxID=2303991 RepID=A0A372LI93_9BACI|nr:phosphatidylserine decarboxylase [Peribacillus glennii]RFU65789.1 phosphatidylserine decarboxylase [Peribacillus glennii]
MLQPFYRILIELTNGRISSAALKKFSRSVWSRRLISGYAKVYNIDKEEIADDIHSFKSLHDFFTRRLKADARMIDDDERSVASPVDGVLEDFGDINVKKQIVVKGKSYSILEMLGDDTSVQRYLNGKYMVLYLSPSHYHRIHAPVAGKVISRRILGRKSYPVNRMGMKYGRSTLSKNYRNITEVEHEVGHMAIVKVGAMFVNSIIITDESEHLSKGQEFAYFSFGSTVVLLFEKDTFHLSESMPIPSEIRVGEKIGYVRNN